MKIQVLLLCAAAAATSGAPATDVITFRSKPYSNHEGIYSFEYVLSDGTYHRQEGVVKNKDSADAALSVTGEYSWVAPDGSRHTTRYSADENGYAAREPELNQKPVHHPVGLVNCLVCG